MDKYPHENAEMLGQEMSEQTFKDWEKFWETPDCTKIGFIEASQGASGDDFKTKTKERNGDSGACTGEKASNKSASNSTQSHRRWIFSMRHGERVDLTFGTWVPYCFDENNTYTRKDLNMPEILTERAGGGRAYGMDSPLTRLGEFQARLVGEGLRAAGVMLTHVYSSTALRSVATAHHMLLGLGADPSVKIKVDSGLFEFKNWHLSEGMIPIMTLAELSKAGYNVDLNYKPYAHMDLTTPETLQEFYKRNEFVIQESVKKTETEGGNIMFVGHATTLEITAMALKVLNAKKPVHYELSKTLNRVPYCALGAMKDKPFEVVCPPCPTLMNSSSGKYNWKLYLNV